MQRNKRYILVLDEKKNNKKANSNTCVLSNVQGITLIALVITIIVLLILAGVSINLVMGDNGVLSKSKMATITQKFAKYKEDLELGMYGKVTIAGDTLNDYVQSMNESDKDKFAIINGELYYIGNDEQEANIAKGLGINLNLSGAGAEVVRDIQTIINKVIPIKDRVTFPTNDDEVASSEIIGTRLYDKNSQNGDRWKLVIDYDDYNTETGRYGSGNYLLKSGENYSVNGENITFSKDYIINYDNLIIGLTEKAVEWSLNSTLAVSRGLVLNIDPTNLADGRWTGITKHGDVQYDSSSKALLFNEDTVNNPTGEGGYLELKRSGVDFSNGFTFEMYTNLSRGMYVNESGVLDAGYFCRTTKLSGAQNFTSSLRFGWTNDKAICKLYGSSSWAGNGYGILSTDHSGAIFSTELGYDINEDVYVTITYIRYDENQSAEYKEKYFDEYMIKNKVDKLAYYINGELVGYTYYGYDSYSNAIAVWNGDDCPFFLGVCPWDRDGNLYYLKGKIYTTRLYTTSMTSEEVKENMDMTQKYRASF